MAVVDQQAEKTPSVTEVRSRLREAVLRSELPPGTDHSQGDVRTFLDVGRTPFREALRMVQAEELVEILPNGRLKIPPLSMANFTEIQICRIALESAALRISIPRLGPDDLAYLEGFMAQMSQYLSSEHFDRVEEPHQEFHRRLVAAAGPDLQAKIVDLTYRAARYRWAFPTVALGHWEVRSREHRAILDAAKAGDPEGVAAHLALHYLESSLRLADAMEETEEGHRRSEEAILTSLAPTVRKAVLALRA